MPNYLKMPKKSQVLALLELGWSYRRIEAEIGVRRETVSRYDQTRRSNAAKTFPGSDASPPSESPGLQPGEEANAAKTFAGSDPKPAKTFPGSPPRPRFAAALYRTAIIEKLDAGLSLQRIWQDLVEEYRLRRELRIGEAVRAHHRAKAPRGRGLSLRARGRGTNRFLPRRADTRCGHRRVASTVGVSPDARPFATWLRGSGLGSEARDVPSAARAGVSRYRRRPDASYGTTI